MGIPLPALDVRPIQQPNPLDEYAKAISIRSMQNQQQLQQGQTQLQQAQLVGEQQKNQMGGLQLQDQMLWRKIAADSSTDWTKPEAMGNALQKFTQSGGNPLFAQQIRMANVDYLSKLSTMNKTDFETHQAKMDDVLGRFTSVNGIQDPAQRQQAYQQHLQELQANGSDTSKWPQQVPDSATLGTLIHGLQSQKAQTEWYAAQGRNKPTLDSILADTTNTDPGVATRAKAAAAAIMDWNTASAAKTATARTIGENTPEAAAAKGTTAATVANAEIPAKTAQAVAEAKATQPIKVETAGEEETARQNANPALQAKWMRWTDPSSGVVVAGPMSMAKASGAKDVAELPAQEVRDVQNARHAVNLMTKQGDPTKPETQGVLQLIDGLAKDNKLGVLASRWNRFMTSGVGTEPGDDPRIITLINKNMLADTATMLAHFGASGGRSPIMLQHFIDLADSGKMDAGTLRAGTKAIADYMQDRAMMPRQTPNTSPGTAAQPGAGSDWGTQFGGAAH